MALYCEIWARPGAPTFGRVIDDIPNPYQTFHDGINIVGDGTLQVPNTFDRFDEILLIDETTPSNCVSSLVRIFDDSDPTTPIFEWLPSSILPTTDKFDPNVDISGEGIKSIMRYARVEAYDWDGSLDFSCSQCDWVYGGPNIVTNPGQEDSPITPLEYRLEITATGGTFTITDGTDTTSAIAFDASANTIQTRIETDIAAITDVLVSEQSGVYLITYVTPPFSPTISLNTGSLTGGTATLLATQDGGRFPNPWTIAGSLNADLSQAFVYYDNFGVSDVQAHSGSLSLLVDPGQVFQYQHRNPGAQQVLSVTPGAVFQASVWIYPTSASDEFRFGIFGIGEEVIALDANGLGGATYTPNTWNEITITDGQIPDGVTQVIFRVQCTNGPSDPSVFYIDDALFREGLAPTTIGAIIGDLYADATSEHAGRIVWEDDANPGNPYLTLDFTDSVDSAGDAWFHSEIEIKLWMRMTYLQVLDQFSQTYGYEWRVVPDDVEAGTWKLQIYNPGGMQVDYTTAASPGIQTGSRDTRRSVRRFVPAGTQFLVEGTDRLTARDEDTDLSGSLGRIETSRISRQLPSLGSVGDAAFEDKVDALVNGLTYSYTLTDPEEVPLSDYLIGDALHIEDPPQVSDNARFIDVEVVVSPNGTEFEVQLSPQSAAGS